MDMYKGIGQNFSFHVEMNPFQKGQNSFHPRLYSEGCREASFFLLYFTPVHLKKRWKISKTCNAPIQVFVVGNISRWKEKKIIFSCVSFLQMCLNFCETHEIFHSRPQWRRTETDASRCQAFKSQRTRWDEEGGPRLPSDEICWTYLLIVSAPSWKRRKPEKQNSYTTIFRALKCN